MFVKPTLTLCASAIALSTAFAIPAFAGEITANATLTVEITDVQTANGPLYVSIQSRNEYKQTQHSAGGIYKDIAAGTLTYAYEGLAAGEYAVSLWHDIDNDGKFSLSETYMPLDGWGSSGKQLTAAPTFDDVKFTMGNTPQTLRIKMHYPQ